MKSERLYKKEGDQWSPLRRADVVTYGVIGAKGVPYEVNGKSRCAVKCGVCGGKGTSRAPSRTKILHKKRGDQRSPHIAEKIILRLLR